MMLEVDHTWVVPAAGSSLGVSTNVAPSVVLKLKVPCLHVALYCQASTIASTQSFSLQTAQSSAGPWATEGSTAVSANGTSNSCDVLRLTGPYLFARPRLNSVSTGSYTFRLVGVG